MNRTRYHCRNIDRDREQYREPAVLMQCPRCDEYIRTLIAEMMQFAKEEYARGLRESANVLHAHADRVLRGKEVNRGTGL